MANSGIIGPWCLHRGTCNARAFGHIFCRQSVFVLPRPSGLGDIIGISRKRTQNLQDGKPLAMEKSGN